VDNEVLFTGGRYASAKQKERLAEQHKRRLVVGVKFNLFVKRAAARQMETLQSLRRRNQQVINEVEQLTAEADEQLVGDKYQKKVVLRLGQPKISPIASVEQCEILCGLTLIGEEPFDPSIKDPSRQAEFSFAYVPASTVQHYIDNPYDLHNHRIADENGVLLMMPELSPNYSGLSGVLDLLPAEYPDDIDHHIVVSRWAIEHAEENLAAVKEFAAL